MGRVLQVALVVFTAAVAMAQGQSSLPATATPATTASAQLLDDPSTFLALAGNEVQKYIDSFADLTADETRKIELFDEHGFPKKSRSMTAALVVYQLQSESKTVLEYRDIETVDGKPVKDHAERAVKIWQELTREHSPEEEAKRIVDESERFDYGVRETGFTLYQGLPLRRDCANDFQFHELARSTVNGHAVRQFAYTQRRPCDAVQYALAVPPEYVGSPLVQQGALWLDAATGQIVREDRDVYVGVANSSGWRVAHMEFNYTDSAFGLLLPSAIRLETYYPEMSVGNISRLPMVTRITQTYGPFSRFEVDVKVKNAVANDK